MNKQQLLAKLSQKEVKTIDVPEVGEIIIRAITCTEKDTFQLSVYKNQKLYRATLLSLFIADDNGNRLFGDEDIAELGSLPAKAAEFIFEEGLVFNGMAGTIEKKV